jgi:hypothetical protein
MSDRQLKRLRSADIAEEIRVPHLKKRDFSVFRPGYRSQSENGFRPRRDLPPVAMNLPFDWGMDPFQDRNWCFQLHAWRMLDPIWHEFFEVDWERLKSEVMPWVADWHRYHVVESREARFSWYDMSAGMRAQHLALIVHLHKRGLMVLTAGELSLIRSLSELHVVRLCAPGFIAMNNHGLFQLRGLRLLGEVWGGERFTRGEPAYSAKMMKQLLRRQFDGHGVHRENSPDYHGLLLRKFEEIRPDLFPGIHDDLEATLARAREVFPWFVFPDGTIANIGDSAGAGEPPGRDAKPDQVVRTAVADFWIRDLSASGYVVVRSAADVPADTASMLIVKAQAMSMTHAHADHLAPVLYQAGRHLLADSGKYTYDRDAWREYFVGDRAHNVVGLMGHPFGPHETTTVGPGLTQVRCGDGEVVVEGEIVRGGFFHHRRRMTYLPGERLRVEDWIEARPTDAPIAYWHLASGIDAEIVIDGVELFANGRCLAKLHVKGTDIAPHLVHGQTEPHIQGWISRTYKAKAMATVVEFRALPGCRHIDTTIELFTPPALHAARMPRSLSHGVVPDFAVRFVSDRAGVLPDGRTKRRVIVDLPEKQCDAALDALAGAFAQKGFRQLSARAENGVEIRVLAHPDRTRLSIRATPASKDAPARLAISWLRMLPPGSKPNAAAVKVVGAADGSAPE